MSQHPLSEIEIKVKEFGDWISRGGRAPTIGEKLKQQGRRLKIAARDALHDIGEDLEEFADTLIPPHQKTTAETFIEHAEELYLKLEDAATKSSQSPQFKSLSTAIEGLKQVLSSLIDKVRKMFNLSKEHLFSPSPTVLHRDPPKHKKQAPQAAHKKNTPQERKL